MRKDYSEKLKMKQLLLAEIPLGPEASQDKVGKACLHSSTIIQKSPHINVVLGQMSRKNLKTTAMLLDSGSDINSISINTLHTERMRYRFV